MSTKHTPEPWIMQTLKSDGSQFITKGKNGFVIADVTTSNQIPGITSEEGIANAKLIAAAPDMLEALQNALVELEIYDISAKGQDEDTKRVFEIVKEAIKKATV